MSRCVLVVEDNPANMKLAALLLRQAGYEVRCARTAAEGVAAARASHPALILMDIQLPGMDGLQATRQIKADPDLTNIRIVALTAFAMSGDESRMRAAGCDGYIAKPFDYRAFLAEIERQIGASP